MSDKRSLLMHQRLCARSVCKVADEDFCTCKVAAGFVREMLDRAISAEADNARLRQFLEARFCKECPAEICGHSCVVNELLRGGHNA
ncbi:MAG: hypothetical protein M0R06_26850 [Sphaerochaeta sp.]|nr:hypothetical protein [Sphaerochaeta sp.]